MLKLSVTGNKLGLVLLIAFYCVGAHAEPNSDKAEACIERGIADFKLQKLKEAVEDYREAISFDPHNIKAYRLGAEAAPGYSTIKKPLMIILRRLVLIQMMENFIAFVVSHI